MLWKERFTRMGGGLKWLGSRPVALFFIGLLCCYLGDIVGPVTVDLLSRNAAYARLGGDQSRLCGPRRAVLAVLAILPVRRRGGVEHHLRAGGRHMDQPGDDASHSDRSHSRQTVRRGRSARWLGIAMLAILAHGAHSGRRFIRSG